VGFLPDHGAGDHPGRCLVRRQANPDHVYAGLEEVFESTNAGQTWVTASPYWNYSFACDATNTCPNTTHPDQHAMMIVDGKIVIGNDGGVYSRPLSDGAEDGNWADLIPGGGSGHVFETWNGGKTWTDISGNLPDIASDALVLAHGKLALATDAGVYTASESEGTHTTWLHLGTGLPNVAVDDLTSGPGGYIYAATHGRGVWRFKF
jgi:hypothetical protein